MPRGHAPRRAFIFGDVEPEDGALGPQGARGAGPNRPLGHDAAASGGRVGRAPHDGVDDDGEGEIGEETSRAP